MVDSTNAGLVIAATNALIRLKNPYLNPDATEKCWETKQLEELLIDVMGEDKFKTFYDNLVLLDGLKNI